MNHYFSSPLAINLLQTILGGLTVAAIVYLIYEIFLKQSYKPTNENPAPQTRKPLFHVFGAIGILMAVLLLDGLYLWSYFIQPISSKKPATNISPDIAINTYQENYINCHDNNPPVDCLWRKE